MFGRHNDHCKHSGHDRFEFARRSGFGSHHFHGAEEGGPGRGQGNGGPYGRGRFFENGMLRLIILALVSEQPRHGYEIMKELEDRSGGLYTPSAGVIYPTLTMLEEADEIEAQASEGTKKLYKATDAGQKAIEQNRQAIDAVFARFEAMGAAAGPERDPRIMRAVENFKMALKLKTRGGALSKEQIGELAILLDETARKIENI